jgi:hypothetical protein
VNLGRYGDFSGEVAEFSHVWDGIEQAVNEVLNPAGIEIASVALLHDGTVDDADLIEVMRVDDGAIRGWVKPIHLYLSTHVDG